MLVNSIGKMYLVDGLAPMDLSVSKYCKVIVFWSTDLGGIEDGFQSDGKTFCA